MPNTFAPRAMERVMKARTELLRASHQGPATDIAEWHGLLDMMDEESTEEFLEEYNKVEDIPEVVDGVDHSDNVEE